jgi:hypothetical protein
MASPMSGELHVGFAAVVFRGVSNTKVQNGIHNKFTVWGINASGDNAYGSSLVSGRISTWKNEIQCGIA